MEASGGWRKGKNRETCSVCREGCGQLYALTFFSWGNSLLYPLNRRFGGPHGPPGRVGKDKNLTSALNGTTSPRFHSSLSSHYTD